MKRILEAMLLALTPIVRPRRLAAVAADTPTQLAVPIGLIATTCIVTAFAIGLASGVSEPYRSLDDYLSEVLVSVVGAPMGVFVVVTVVYSAVVAISFGCHHLHRRGSWREPEYIASIRARTLTPLVLLIPVMIWLPFRVLRIAAEPIFGIHPGTKPEWLQSPIILVLGSVWWAPAFVFAWILISEFAAASAFRRVAQKLDRPYPECGAERIE